MYLLTLLVAILIAILDTGMDVHHEHFANTTITTYNVVDNNQDVSEQCKHGTATAGIVHSSAPHADILMVKVYPTGLCQTSGTWWEAGLRYAVDAGARIVVMPLGSTQVVPEREGSIDYAVSKGVLVVASAGNEGNTEPYYPAFFEGTLAVGALDWLNSNYGDFVDVYAPATQYTAFNFDGTHDDYAEFTGTSAATPYVAGLAARLLQKNPTWGIDDLREAIGPIVGLYDVHMPIVGGIILWQNHQ